MLLVRLLLVFGVCLSLTSATYHYRKYLKSPIVVLRQEIKEEKKEVEKPPINVEPSKNTTDLKETESKNRDDGKASNTNEQNQISTVILPEGPASHSLYTVKLLPVGKSEEKEKSDEKERPTTGGSTGSYGLLALPNFHLALGGSGGFSGGSGGGLSGGLLLSGSGVHTAGGGSGIHVQPSQHGGGGHGTGVHGGGLFGSGGLLGGLGSSGSHGVHGQPTHHVEENVGIHGQPIHHEEGGHGTGGHGGSIVGTGHLGGLGSSGAHGGVHNEGVHGTIGGYGGGIGVTGGLFGGLGVHEQPIQVVEGVHGHGGSAIHEEGVYSSSGIHGGSIIGTGGAYGGGILSTGVVHGGSVVGSGGNHGGGILGTGGVYGGGGHGGSVHSSGGIHGGGVVSTGGAYGTGYGGGGLLGTGGVYGGSHGSGVLGSGGIHGGGGIVGSGGIYGTGYGGVVSTGGLYGNGYGGGVLSSGGVHGGGVVGSGIHGYDTGGVHGGVRPTGYITSGYGQSTYHDVEDTGTHGQPAHQGGIGSIFGNLFGSFRPTGSHQRPVHHVAAGDGNYVEGQSHYYTPHHRYGASDQYPSSWEYPLYTTHSQPNRVVFIAALPSFHTSLGLGSNFLETGHGGLAYSPWPLPYLPSTPVQQQHHEHKPGGVRQPEQTVAAQSANTQESVKPTTTGVKGETAHSDVPKDTPAAETVSSGDSLETVNPETAEQQKEQEKRAGRALKGFGVLEPIKEPSAEPSDTEANSVVGERCATCAVPGKIPTSEKESSKETMREEDNGETRSSANKQEQAAPESGGFEKDPKITGDVNLRTSVDIGTSQLAVESQNI